MVWEGASAPKTKQGKEETGEKAVPRQAPFHGNHAKVRLSSKQEGSRVVVAPESKLGSAGSQAGPQHTALLADWRRPLSAQELSCSADAFLSGTTSRLTTAELGDGGPCVTSCPALQYHL